MGCGVGRRGLRAAGPRVGRGARNARRAGARLDTRQWSVTAQAGAQTGPAPTGEGQLLGQFGPSGRVRTGTRHSQGGGTVANAKLPTGVVIYDGHVLVTFTFQHGTTTWGHVGIVPVVPYVPTHETESVQDVENLFQPPASLIPLPASEPPSLEDLLEAVSTPDSPHDSRRATS